MPVSDLRLIKRASELCPQTDIPRIPPRTRGIYVLLRHRPRLGRYDVVYVGMAACEKTGIRGRLMSHAKSRRKGNLWTHFSAFEVWYNICYDEVRELEGLFRHIYRKDTRANKLNRQKSFGRLNHVRRKDGKACTPIATFAHGVVQKLLKPDNGARRKGMP